MKEILLAAILAVTALLLAGPALGDSTYYDATNSIIDVANPVGTRWHELYPNYCTSPYEITDWKDNGDGYLSYCDTIDMTYDPDGADPQTSTEHVIEVTYTLEVLWAAQPGEPHFWDWQYVEDRDPITEPVCTWWTEIYPDLGLEWHIQAWEDNASGELDFCDFIVDDDGGQWHVEGVHTDIVTEPVSGSATEPSTWGKVKAFFERW